MPSPRGVGRDRHGILAGSVRPPSYLWRGEDLDAEGMRDLMGDPHVAETRIALLRVDDGRDELRGRTFGTGFAAMRRRGKEEAVFAIHEGSVELEQRCWFDERAKLRNPARIHEQRGQSEHKAIERGQIRSTVPRPIADQQLMFQ